MRPEVAAVMILTAVINYPRDQTWVDPCDHERVETSYDRECKVPNGPLLMWYHNLYIIIKI